MQLSRYYLRQSCMQKGQINMTSDAAFDSELKSGREKAAPHAPEGAKSARQGSLTQAALQALLSGFFSRLIIKGRLVIRDPWDCVHQFGPDQTPFVRIRITTPAAMRNILLWPDLNAGEAYMDGTLVIEEGGLRDFLYLCTLNQAALYSYWPSRALTALGRALRKLQQINPRARAAANVAHHYDLSGALYDLFLDADRQYSCAYFPEGNESLEQAQLRKKQHIAAKLLLQPGQRVLDIGCGWGGLALHLAQTPGTEVTGITLSQEQWKTATQRAADAHLSGRTHFHLRDYRDENGEYDRLVSVGMFEHVGVNHYPAFFNKCRAVLKPDGVGLLHAIGRMEPPAATNPWIRKYIFPGGYCPALSEVLGAIEHSGLWVTDIEILRPHYADTLRHWQERFQASRDTARALYDERFCRMWEFYLASCEMSFRTGRMMVFQILFARNRDAVPRTRAYMDDAGADPCTEVSGGRQLTG